MSNIEGGPVQHIVQSFSEEADLVSSDIPTTEKLVLAGALLIFALGATLLASRASEGTVYRVHEKALAWGVALTAVAVNVLANYELWS